VIIRNAEDAMYADLRYRMIPFFEADVMGLRVGISCGSGYRKMMCCNVQYPFVHYKLYKKKK
jgi:hypothetical protein